MQLLDGHPWFKVVALTGSERAVGQSYAHACHWILPNRMPAWAAEMQVLPNSPDGTGARLAFSALPASAAVSVEPLFAGSGVAVCTNASTFRTAEDVALVLPEVNPEHTALIERQRQERGWSGSIVANAGLPHDHRAETIGASNPCWMPSGCDRRSSSRCRPSQGRATRGCLPWISWVMWCPTSMGRRRKDGVEPRKMLGGLQDEGGDTGGRDHLRPRQPRAGDRRSHAMPEC